MNDADTHQNNASRLGVGKTIMPISSKQIGNDFLSPRFLVEKYHSLSLDSSVFLTFHFILGSGKRRGRWYGKRRFDQASSDIDHPLLSKIYGPRHGIKVSRLINETFEGNLCGYGPELVKS